MPMFPGYRFPFQYYKPYGRNNFPNNCNPQYHTPIPKPQPTPQIETPHTSSKTNKSPDPIWFDLFGIKLYFDDVLILSLLFFLYNEEVKDEGLFLALVLLLIS